MDIPIADPDGCGMGLGSDCCAYLIVSSGFECARETSLAPTLRAKVAAGHMTAQRLPTEPIPECQIFSGAVEVLTEIQTDLSRTREL